MCNILNAAVLVPILLAATPVRVQVIANSESAWQVRSEPDILVNGAPGLLRVVPPTTLRSLSGSWMGHKVFFGFAPESRAWYGLFGADLSSEAGQFPLVLS